MGNECNTSVQARRGTTATAPESADFIMGTSPGMRALERAVADLADCGIPVLLLGETGSGKTALARHIHMASTRRNMPFIHLSCASITPSFFEQVPGRAQDQIVRLANLQPGTLYLDEITDLPIPCQAQFLRGFFESAVDDTTTSWRLIMSSRRDLEQEVREERLREDLYYHIRGVCLQIPPLRHRRDDIPLLTDFFFARYSSALNRPHPRLDAQALQLLLEHSWPGNVRQLEETAKALVMSGKPQYTSEELAAIIGHSGKQGILSLKQAAREASRQAERELILRVLARTRGNRKRAAEQLQISYKALLYKLKQIAIEDGFAESRGTTL